MNAGLVEGAGIAKTVAGGGMFGRGALLLSMVVHGGLAAAFLGWADPAPTGPIALPVAIVAVASAPAAASDDAAASGAPLIAQAPHQPAVTPPGVLEPPAAPIADARAEPVPEPQTETAIEEPVAAFAQPSLQAALPDPVIEPRPDAMADPLPAPAAKPGQPPAAAAPEPAPAEIEPVAVPQTAPQTAALPNPATAQGTALDNLETGGAGVEPARYDVAALSNPEPDYPWASRRAGEEGRVVLRVEVSAAGTVDAIEVAESSGHRRLDTAALEAVRQWRFEPARVGEQAIATSVSVPITFRLE